MTDDDLKWLELKRLEMKRARKKFKDQFDMSLWDCPRFLRIIDELISSPCEHKWF